MKKHLEEFVNNLVNTKTIKSVSYDYRDECNTIITIRTLPGYSLNTSDPDISLRKTVVNPTNLKIDVDEVYENKIKELFEKIKELQTEIEILSFKYESENDRAIRRGYKVVDKLTTEQEAIKKEIISHLNKETVGAKISTNFKDLFIVLIKEYKQMLETGEPKFYRGLTFNQYCHHKLGHDTFNDLWKFVYEGSYSISEFEDIHKISASELNFFIDGLCL